MACASCGTKNNDGTPAGCGSKGHCSSGGCNRMSTFDWLTIEGIRDVEDQHYAEVSFKNGARKDFFYNPPDLLASTGDTVVVETATGFDTGVISLSGELVIAQMKKKHFKIEKVRSDIIRKAHQKDLERMAKARELEKSTLVRARVIAYSTELPLKLSDIEYQGDLKKATFYYTAEERIDFRELIKLLSREFKIKVEMRHIKAREETARLGGIGTCGRELCCSTWLSDFQKVTTHAARYQGLSLQQAKLSGQCGRLKCCLNFELDTYIDALKDFPKKSDKLKLKNGKAILVKTNVFKGEMVYHVMKGKERLGYATLRAEDIHAIINNPEAETSTILGIEHARIKEIEEAQEEEIGYDDVTGAIDIPLEKRKKRRKKKPGAKARSPRSKQPSSRQPTSKKGFSKKEPNPTQSKKTNTSSNRNSSETQKDRKSNPRQGSDNKPRRNNKRRFNKKEQGNAPVAKGSTPNRSKPTSKPSEGENTPKKETRSSRSRKNFSRMRKNKNSKPKQDGSKT